MRFLLFFLREHQGVTVHFFPCWSEQLHQSLRRLHLPNLVIGEYAISATGVVRERRPPHDIDSWTYKERRGTKTKVVRVMLFSRPSGVVYEALFHKPVFVFVFPVSFCARANDELPKCSAIARKLPSGVVLPVHKRMDMDTRYGSKRGRDWLPNLFNIITVM